MSFDGGGGAPAAEAIPSTGKQPRNSLKMIRTRTLTSPGSATTEELNNVEKLAIDGITIVVIGASGDLAKKKTYPALMELYLSDFLPRHSNIVGFARSEMADDKLRASLKPYLLKTCPGATDVRACVALMVMP